MARKIQASTPQAEYCQQVEAAGVMRGMRNAEKLGRLAAALEYAVGELAAVAMSFDRVPRKFLISATTARELLQDKYFWGGMRIPTRDFLDQATERLIQVQGAVLVMAEVLGQVSGKPFDIYQETLANPAQPWAQHGIEWTE